MSDCILNEAKSISEMIGNNWITDAFSVLYPDVDISRFDVFTHEIERLLSNDNLDRFWRE